MVDDIIDNNGDVNMMTKLIYLTFKDDKNFDNLDKIRVGISEEIFRKFMGKAEYHKKEADKYDDDTDERKTHIDNYLKIYDISLKLKDANYKDRIMRSYKKLINK